MNHFLIPDFTEAHVEQIIQNYSNNTPIVIESPYWPTSTREEARSSLASLLKNSEEAPFVVFTSGTSGRPKAVVHNHKSVSAAADITSRFLNLDKSSNYLLSLPLFHVGGLSVIFRTHQANARLTLTKSDDVVEKLLRDDSITHVSLVPTQLIRLIDRMNKLNLRNLPWLKCILLGGAAVPEHLCDEALLHDLPIFKSYGMTETFGMIAAVKLVQQSPINKTSGRPLGTVKIRIASNSRVLVQSPTLMKGYWHKHQLDRPFDNDGFFLTQDCGSLRSEFLEISGRIDRQFKSGGELIQPEEIETLIKSIPTVVDAKVHPVEDREYGYVPHVMIQIESSQIDTDELKNEIKSVTAALPGLKRPKRIDFVLTQIDSSLKSRL